MEELQAENKRLKLELAKLSGSKKITITYKTFWNFVYGSAAIATGGDTHMLWKEFKDNFIRRADQRVMYPELSQEELTNLWLYGIQMWNDGKEE